MIWQGKGSKIPKIWLTSFVHGPSPCFCFILLAKLFTQPHFSVALCHLFELVMLDRDLCLKWGSPCQNFMTIPKSNLVLFHRLGYSNSAFVHTRRPNRPQGAEICVIGVLRSSSPLQVDDRERERTSALKIGTDRSHTTTISCSLKGWRERTDKKVRFVSDWVHNARK